MSPLQLAVIAYRNFYLPGDRVVCTVQVSNVSPAPVTLRDLVFSASGLERADTQWIKRLQRADTYPVEVSEPRKLGRTLFHAQCALLMPETVIPAGAGHQFRVRFRLPSVLPPSFRGQSCRFTYKLTATAGIRAIGTELLIPEVVRSKEAHLVVWPSPATLRSMPSSSLHANTHDPFSQQHTAASLQPPDSPSAVSHAASDRTFTSMAESTSAPAQGQTSNWQQQQQQSQTPHAGAAAPSQLVDTVPGARTNVIDYPLQQRVRIRSKAVRLDLGLTHGGAPANGALESPPPGGTPAQATRASSLVSIADRASSSTSDLRAADLKAALNAHDTYKAEFHHRQTRSHLRHAHVRAALQQADTDSDSEDEDDAEGEGSVWAGRSSHRSTGLPSTRSLPGPAIPAKQQSQTLWGHGYSLKLREHSILKLTLQAPLESLLQPGASFGGLVDLRPSGLHSNPSLVCHQLVVLLETEEVVSSEYSARGIKRNGGIRKLFCEHQELTSNLSTTQFLFSIPTTATPSFETPLVALRWMLRFELAVGPPLPIIGIQEPNNKPQQFEHMVWALPLQVQSPASM